MSKLNEAEVRERAEAFRRKYPDHYKPMDTLGYVADANVIIRDLLTLLDEKDKVIEGMPKTADGVPIEIGNVYFYRAWSDDTLPHISRSVYVRGVRVDSIEIDSGGKVSYSGPCSIEYNTDFAAVTIEDASDLYSTREAALARDLQDRPARNSSGDSQGEDTDPFPNLHKEHWIRKDDDDTAY